MDTIPLITPLPDARPQTLTELAAWWQAKAHEFERAAQECRDIAREIEQAAPQQPTSN